MATDLSNYTTYYWRVKSKDSTGEVSSWSVSGTFETDAVSVPTVYRLKIREVSSF